MTLENEIFRLLNITLLYDNINPQSVMSDKIRTDLATVVGSEHSPIVTLIPQMLIVAYPTLQVTATIDNRRLGVNDGSQKKIGERPLTAVASKIYEIIGKDEIVAYGFNYALDYTNKGKRSLDEYFYENFVPKSIQKKFPEILISTSPRLHFKINGVSYDLRLEPDFLMEKPERIRIHLNIHYKKNGKIKLPKIEELDKQFNEGFKWLKKQLVIL